MENLLFTKCDINDYCAKKKDEAEKISLYTISDKQLSNTDNLESLFPEYESHITVSNISIHAISMENTNSFYEENINVPYTEISRKTKGLKLEVIYSIKTYGNTELLEVYTTNNLSNKINATIKNNSIEFTLLIKSKEELGEKIEEMKSSINKIDKRCKRLNQWINDQNIDQSIKKTFIDNLTKRKELLSLSV